MITIKCENIKHIWCQYHFKNILHNDNEHIKNTSGKIKENNFPLLLIFTLMGKESKNTV